MTGSEISYWQIGGYSIDGNDAWALIRDRLFREDATSIPVVYAHGHSSLPNPALVLLYDNLLLGDAGHAVARSGRQVMMADLQNNAWGNDASVLGVAFEILWLQQHLGAALDKVCLMGGSMGFLPVCNFVNWCSGAFEIPGFEPPDIEITGLVGIIPATDHNNIRERNYQGYAAEIVAAYGGQAAYDTARPTHNPIEYASELKVPSALFYSSNDPATLPVSVEGFGGAATSEMHNLGDVGHTYVGMDLDAIAEFFDRHP